MFTPLTAVNVPLVIVSALVVPRVKLLPSCQVPPTPLKVIGKSNVAPLVTVCVPEVATKVTAEEEAPFIVIPAGIVNPPHKVSEFLVQVPEKPIKFKFV